MGLQMRKEKEERIKGGKPISAGTCLQNKDRLILVREYLPNKGRIISIRTYLMDENKPISAGTCLQNKDRLVSVGIYLAEGGQTNIGRYISSEQR